MRYYAAGQLFGLAGKGVVTNCKAVTMLGTVRSQGFSPTAVPEKRSMTEEKIERPTVLEELRSEVPVFWKSVPYKGVFVSLLVGWVLLFELLGNSTFA